MHQNSSVHPGYIGKLTILLKLTVGCRVGYRCLCCGNRFTNACRRS